MALGLGQVPYRLAGDARDVVDDIHRFGGRAYATHADSPKAELAWTDWRVPLDGFEWLNADTEWRNESTPRLLLTLAHYLVRPPESLASLFAAPRLTRTWDVLSMQGRRLVSFVGADAHARLGWQSRRDPGNEAGWYLAAPSYEQVFRTLSITVELDAPLGGQPIEDSARILSAINAGRLYSTIDGVARGGALDFHGESSSGLVEMGRRVTPGELQRLVARVRAPARTTLSLLRNGDVVAETTGLSLEYDPRTVLPAPTGSAATVYRVEARVGGADRTAAPWLVSNPIWESTEATPPGQSAAAPAAPEPIVAASGRPATGRPWVTEHDAASTGSVSEQRDGVIALRFSLAPGEGPRWVAAVTPLSRDDLSLLSRAGATIRLELRASRPLRASIQLRAPSLPTEDLRWSRSVFVGLEMQPTVVDLHSLRPVNAATAGPPLRDGATLLIVVDDENTWPGTSGVLWVKRLELRPAAM